MKGITGVVLFINCWCNSEVLGIILQDVTKFVTDLKGFYTLNTLLIFQSDECLNNENCLIDELLQITTPVMLISHHSHKRLKDGLSMSQTLTIIVMNSASDPIKKEAMYALGEMRLSKIIFVLLYDNVRHNRVQELFGWCWEYNMLNSVAVFYNKYGQFNVFTYNPFPHMKIHNNTYERIENIFPDKIKDLFGYKIRSPVKLDPPHVFKMMWRGKETITGLAGRTLSEYVRSINGSFQEYLLPDSTSYIDMKEIYKLLQLRKIDISIHPHGNLNKSLFSVSYPLAKSFWCIMVPVISEIPSFLYVILAFNDSVWGVIFLEIITVAVALSFVNYFVSGRLKLGKAFCDSLKGALYITIPGVKLQNKWQCTAISGLALFGGFILTNIYLATLTSYFTRTAYGSQINTFDDLKRHGLKVMMTELDESTLLHLPYFPKEITPLLHPVDVDTLAIHRDNFNASYAYLVSEGKWFYLQQQEQYKRHPSFRITNMCFGDFFLSYPMQSDSPFMEPLRTFIMKSHQYGLKDIWISQTFREAVRAGLAHIHSEPEQPLHIITFGHFTFLWYLLGIGYLAGFLIFILEHLLHRMNSNQLIV